MLSSPQPYGVKLSRKRVCAIYIGNNAFEEKMEVNKEHILKHFLAGKETSWRS
jgi:hypothetical protein